MQQGSACEFTDGLHGPHTAEATLSAARRDVGRPFTQPSDGCALGVRATADLAEHLKGESATTGASLSSRHGEQRTWRRTLVSMPERSRKHRPTDLNSLAASIVADSTDEDKDDQPADDGKDPAAVALGRKGGLKGGRARADKLTSQQRSEIARKAAEARWDRRSD